MNLSLWVRLAEPSPARVRHRPVVRRGGRRSGLREEVITTRSGALIVRCYTPTVQAAHGTVVNYRGGAWSAKFVTTRPSIRCPPEVGSPAS